MRRTPARSRAYEYYTPGNEGTGRPGPLWVLER